MALVLAGVIILSLSKKGSDIDLGEIAPIVDKFAKYLPIEGPETAIAFCKYLLLIYFSGCWINVLWCKRSFT